MSTQSDIATAAANEALALLSPEKSDNYPLLGYNFKVTATDSDTGKELLTSEASYFRSISGISASSTGKGVKVTRDGKSYTLPSPPEFQPLILEGGLVGSKSPLSKWCETYINGIKPSGSLLSEAESMYNSKTINVFLMDRQNDSPVMQWTFYDCTPVSIKMSPFLAEKAEVAIETLEIRYSGYEIS